MPVWGWIPVIILGQLAFFSCILCLIGFFSGWWTLARAYPHTGHFVGTRRRFRSIRLGAASYNGCVTVGTSTEGLYLATFPLFRPGHPPLFIPWSDVSADVVKGWFWTRYLELRFTRTPGVRVRVPEALGQQIATDANLAWRGG